MVLVSNRKRAKLIGLVKSIESVNAELQEPHNRVTLDGRHSILFNKHQVIKEKIAALLTELEE